MYTDRDNRSFGSFLNPCQRVKVERGYNENILPQKRKSPLQEIANTASLPNKKIGMSRDIPEQRPKPSQSGPKLSVFKYFNSKFNSLSAKCALKKQKNSWKSSGYEMARKYEIKVLTSRYKETFPSENFKDICEAVSTWEELHFSKSNSWDEYMKPFENMGELLFKIRNNGVTQPYLPVESKSSVIVSNSSTPAKENGLGTSDDAPDKYQPSESSMEKLPLKTGIFSTPPASPGAYLTSNPNLDKNLQFKNINDVGLENANVTQNLTKKPGLLSKDKSDVNASRTLNRDCFPPIVAHSTSHKLLEHDNKQDLDNRGKCTVPPVKNNTSERPVIQSSTKIHEFLSKDIKSAFSKDLTLLKKPSPNKISLLPGNIPQGVKHEVLPTTTEELVRPPASNLALASLTLQEQESGRLQASNPVSSTSTMTACTVSVPSPELLKENVNPCPVPSRNVTTNEYQPTLNTKKINELRLEDISNPSTISLDSTSTLKVKALSIIDQNVSPRLAKLSLSSAHDCVLQKAQSVFLPTPEAESKHPQESHPVLSSHAKSPPSTLAIYTVQGASPTPSGNLTLKSVIIPQLPPSNSSSPNPAKKVDHPNTLSVANIITNECQSTNLALNLTTATESLSKKISDANPTTNDVSLKLASTFQTKLSTCNDVKSTKLLLSTCHDFVSKKLESVALSTTEVERKLPSAASNPILSTPAQPPPPSSTILVTDIVKLIEPFCNEIMAEEPPNQFNKDKLSGLFTCLKNNLRTLESEGIRGINPDLRRFIGDFWSEMDSLRKGLQKKKPSDTFCIKIGNIFETNMNEVMRKLGFCCGVHRVFKPHLIKCPGKFDCKILPGADYHCFESWLFYCTKCFDKFHEFVDIGNYNEDDTFTVNRKIPKSSFVSRKNDSEPENFVECRTCCRVNHVICERHLKNESENSFKCSHCLKKEGKEKPRPRAKNFPKTKLSNFIEEKVNTYLADNQNGPHLKIHVRVVASAKKDVAMQPKTGERYNLPPSLPYTEKIIFVFLEEEDADIWFYGFHVHEYGNDSSAPNAGHVYIVNLDSVRFIEPTLHRTSIYHEILLGYLEYAKQTGFTCAHVWVGPLPPKDSDCLFHCRPPKQKIPGFGRLLEWYLSCFDKGKQKGIVLKIQDAIEYMNEVTSPDQLPFIKESPWPETIEELVKKTKLLDHEILAELIIELKKVEHNKTKYLVICLNEKDKLLQDDPDRLTLVPCEFLANLWTFLGWCRKEKIEFSCKPRAKHSSLAIIDIITRSSQGNSDIYLGCKGGVNSNPNSYGVREGEKLNQNEDKPLLENVVEVSETTGGNKIEPDTELAEACEVLILSN